MSSYQLSKSLTLKKRKQFSSIVENVDRYNSPSTASSSLIDLKSQLFKFVVIGESGAGKSNLISRFTRGEFDSRSKSTIGIDFTLHSFVAGSGEYKGQIWDTAGQERYRSMTRLFYRDVCGALLIFDLTNRHHLQALPRWLDEIRTNQHWSSFEPNARNPDSSSRTNSSNSGDDVPIILVGNKVDRRDRVISPEEAREFVRRHRLTSYIETSAKTAENVDDAFQRLFEASIHHFADRKPNVNRSNSIRLGRKSRKDLPNNNHHHQQHQRPPPPISLQQNLHSSHSEHPHSSYSKSKSPHRTKSKCSC